MVHFDICTALWLRLFGSCLPLQDLAELRSKAAASELGYPLLAYLVLNAEEASKPKIFSIRHCRIAMRPSCPTRRGLRAWKL